MSADTDITPITWEAAVERLRRDPAQKALVEACYYDDPLIAAAGRYQRSPEWAAVRRLIGGPRGRALDLGAGRGIASYALAGDGWQVTSVEPDPSAVVGAGAIRALAAESGLSITVEQRWGEQLPFPDSSFSLVLARAVLHHARDLSALCREAARVLEPGGRFLAIREHVISRKADLAAFLASHPLHRHYGGEHAYLLADYESAMRGAGLRVARRLNPFASDINLSPQTRDQLLAGQPVWWRALPRPLGFRLLDLAGARSNAPGRLYSFLAVKPP
jgi:SAM-dependent methyltransferase